jgi:hypothetical protein
MIEYTCRWCQGLCTPTGRFEDDVVQVRCDECGVEQWHPAPNFGADTSYIVDPRWKKFNEVKLRQAQAADPDYDFYYYRKGLSDGGT